jgi:hypothetical protein
MLQLKECLLEIIAADRVWISRWQEDIESFSEVRGVSRRLRLGG